MSRHRWTWGAALAIAGVLALVWLARSSGSGARQDEGVVRLADTAAPPAVAPAVRPVPAKAERIPIAPTRRNGTLAEEQSLRVAYEKRDRGWADRSEAAIHAEMRRIAYVGRGRRLDVKCAASTCEVTGIVDAGPATGSTKPVCEALERDTAGGELRAHGLERTSAVFDTGRAGDEFQIYYRRVDLPQ